jgi:hypothetical protein
MLISTFYGDAFDGQFALRLKESARLIDLECTMYKWGKDGADADKARLRTKLLARSLQERGDESILFVEPDAQILRRPAILLDEEDFDVAVYYDSHTLEVSGPIFLRNNDRVTRLLRDWQDLNHAEPDATELETLSQILSRPGSDLEIRRLPVTYAWVERIHREIHPRANPVIVHFKTNGLISSRIRIPR